MVERCNAVGVRIYVDAVINHMAGMDRQGTGSGGSSFNTMDNNHDFPAVPYSDADFTPKVSSVSSSSCMDLLLGIDICPRKCVHQAVAVLTTTLTRRL